MADNAPEANFRLGNVTATVWSNESASGSVNKKFRTVQVEQRYKDGDEGASLGSDLVFGFQTTLAAMNFFIHSPHVKLALEVKTAYLLSKQIPRWVCRLTAASQNYLSVRAPTS